jgi:hypothetical protein
MTFDEYETLLNAHGWTFLRLKDGTLGQTHLPCGIVHWIDGIYQGVQRSGLFRPSDGMVMLHCAPPEDDCLVDEFLRRCVVVEEAVVEDPVRPRQGSLF